MDFQKINQKGMVIVDENVKGVIMKRLEKVAEALRKNNMEAYVVNDSREAVKTVESILEEGETITCGGSQTLKESGVLELMQSGKYNFLDRSKAKNQEETDRIYREAFCADTYLTSSNAVTKDGELYNVDGNCNRIAAIAFGPKQVIFVVGYNKIVENLEEAVKRVKTIAAPANAFRFNGEMPCRELGNCVSLENGGDMPKGCRCETRMCCNYLVSSFQRKKGRFKVVLVGEELGF